MTTKRDWMLKRLGITQWKLRRHSLLQGEFTVKLPNNVYLLLVANSPPQVNLPLVADIARSLKLTPEQIYALTPKQVMMLPDDVCCHCWWIGLKACREFEGFAFFSSSLAALADNAEAKRVLWRQLIYNEHNIFTHNMCRIKHRD
ncbi:DNA polymerase III subunit psi [Candidatus Hoaglandella endobia]|uniref:DNA polymerase III subunit psi n=1 Tax=Candidatus Hoaglandella endobia TaxID=1778263 RepID=A0A143WUD5_9ENTR|nr:DNA polymerase III subunit psi [Candidatus Hoaglandella endobia]CUX97360.1 DNA polymerase III subunit psi [Candidatus Hoaglandella endobia]